MTDSEWHKIEVDSLCFSFNTLVAAWVVGTGVRVAIESSGKPTTTKSHNTEKIAYFPNERSLLCCIYYRIVSSMYSKQFKQNKYHIYRCTMEFFAVGAHIAIALLDDRLAGCLRFRFSAQFICQLQILVEII